MLIFSLEMYLDEFLLEMSDVECDGLLSGGGDGGARRWREAR